MIFHSYVGLYQSGHKYTNIFKGHWLRREIPRSDQWRQSERTYVGGWVCDIISVISDEHISFRVFVVSLSILFICVYSCYCYFGGLPARWFIQGWHVLYTNFTQKTWHLTRPLAFSVAPRNGSYGPAGHSHHHLHGSGTYETLQSSGGHWRDKVLCEVMYGIVT
jgi:hypothetical protein